LQRVLSPFPAFNYFFGKGSGVYFSVPTKSGDLQLKYFDGKNTKEVGTPNAEIHVGELQENGVESPFFSFSIDDYENTVLPVSAVALVYDQSTQLQKLVMGNKTLVTLTRGENFKGPYYCSEMLRSVFLPGNRYFLFNANYCGNYNGQLLIDTETGQYERLPSNTRVYLTLTTDFDRNYRITGAGMLAK
jgi:hypothetical protein